MSAGDEALARLYLDDIVAQFRKLKQVAERALERMSDEQLTATLDPDANSIAMLVQHMAGNLRSRWTDFLTTDGEKPDRDRDAEFEAAPRFDRAGLLARWEEGWSCLFATLSSLTPDDLHRTVRIRSEPHSVPQAIHRQLTHQAYHTGQLVLLAKHLAGAAWESLTTPKGKSREVNARFLARFGAEAR